MTDQSLQINIMDDAEPEQAPPPSPKRAAIVQAATRLFLESGYSAVSMDTIACVAGVSKRTVYSHFENKESLFGGVMGDLCERLGETPVQSGDLGNDPRDVLTVLGCRLLTLITSPEAVALYRVVVGEVSRSPEIGEVFFRTGRAHVIEWLAAYFAEQNRGGALDIDDPGMAAWQFVEMVKGPIHIGLVLGTAPRPTPAEIDAAVARAVETFLHGYAVHRG